MTAKISIARFL